MNTKAFNTREKSVRAKINMFKVCGTTFEKRYPVWDLKKLVGDFFKKVTYPVIFWGYRFLHILFSKMLTMARSLTKF